VASAFGPLPLSFAVAVERVASGVEAKAVGLPEGKRQQGMGLLAFLPVVQRVVGLFVLVGAVTFLLH